LRRHPLEFILKDPAVSRMRAAVYIEDERILLSGIKVRRLLNPCLNFLAVKAGVPKLFRFSEIQLREEFLVHVGKLPWLRARRINPEEVPYSRRRGNLHHKFRSVSGSTIVIHVLISIGHRRDLSRSHIKLHQVAATLLTRI